MENALFVKLCRRGFETRADIKDRGKEIETLLTYLSDSVNLTKLCNDEDLKEKERLTAILDELNMTNANNMLLRLAKIAQQEARKQKEQQELEAEQTKQQMEFEKATSLLDHPNYMIPLHWVLHEEGFAQQVEQLGMRAGSLGQLQKDFGWTVGFSEAFSKGGQEMLQWFHSHHFGQQCKCKESMGCRESDAVLTIDQLQCAYQSLTSDEDLQLAINAQFPPSASDRTQGVQDLWLVTRHEAQLQKPDARRSKSKQAEGPESFECVALLVYFPVFLDHEPAKAGNASASSSAVDVDRDLLLRGVVPQLYGAPKLTDKMARVEKKPFVFTAPRVHAVVELAFACENDTQPGIKLAGVHGAGKTVLAEMLAQCLPAGDSVDMWHVANTIELWEKKLSSSGNPSFNFLRQSTGCRVNFYCGDPNFVGSHLKTWWTAASKELESISLPSLTGDLFGEKLPSPCISLLDEVNKVCKHLATPPVQISSTTPSLASEASPQASKASETSTCVGVDQALCDAMGKFIYWGEEYKSGVARMQIASPDGRREGAFHKVCNDIFLELRPAPASHLAAVLHLAPQYLLSGTHHIMPRRRTSKAFRRLAVACSGLSGNLRYLSKALAAAASSSPAQPLEHGAAASGAGQVGQDGVQQIDSACNPGGFTAAKFERAAEVRFHSSVGKLSTALLNMSAQSPKEQNTQYLEEADENEPLELKTLWSRTALLRRYLELNASLSVRKVPRNQQSRRVPVGRMNMAVLRAAVRVVHNKLKAGGSTRELHNLMHALLLDDDEELLDGVSFEGLIGVRLCMHCLARNCYSLTDLPQTQENGEHLKARKPLTATLLSSALWHSSSTETVTYEYVECAQPHKMDQPVKDALARLTTGKQSTLVIGTGPSAPYCDFVVVQRLSVRRLSVTFVECTTSTLKDHATRQMTKAQAKLFAKLAGRNTQAQRARSSVLADLWRLVRFGLNGCAQSVANTWLKQLNTGAFLKLSAAKKTAHKWKLECRQIDSSKQCDVAIVFVTGKPLSMQLQDLREFSRVDCDFVFGVGMEELNLKVGSDDTPAASPPGSPAAGAAAADDPSYATEDASSMP